MRLSELLGNDRVAIVRGAPINKGEALGKIAALLSAGCAVPSSDLERVLREREDVQSTGIGEGVAIPHAALPQLEHQVAALLLVPDGMDFGSIDGGKVHLLFAVVGPKRASGEHLKTIARISSFLQSGEVRARLLGARDSSCARGIVVTEEGP